VNEEVVVDIPVGARDGSAMVIPGKGSWGPAGDGDLGVSIRVARHDRFQRDGDDLVTTIDLPLRTALAGGDVVVRGLRGEEVPIVVPRPCQHGQEVVVPGRGIRGGSMRVRVSFKLPAMSDEDIAKLPA
jgi:molecular chaperone DnaJ